MEPFVGEIRLFSFGRAPTGWLPCDGRTLQATQYQALYALIGTLYGGTPGTSFNLPDLQGRVPLCQSSQNPTVGAKGGAEQVSLTAANMPQHTHNVQAYATAGNTLNPNSAFPAVLASGGASGVPTPNMFIPNSNQSLVAMAAGMVSSVGGGQAHENRQPYIAMNYCIAVVGLFPMRQ
ncbi:MAG: tail fiber protein [Rhizomicrobium sp.]